MGGVNWMDHISAPPIPSGEASQESYFVAPPSPTRKKAAHAKGWAK